MIQHSIPFAHAAVTQNASQRLQTCLSIAICVLWTMTPLRELQAQPEDQPVSTREKADAWTPARLADAVERSMKRATESELTVKYYERRNVNAWNGEPTLWVGSEGRYVFRSDARRWFFDGLEFTARAGTSDIAPVRRQSVFDGRNHYSRHRGAIVIGEDQLANPQYSATSLFWHAGRTPAFLLGRLRHAAAEVVETPVTVTELDAVTVETKWRTGETSWQYTVSILPKRSFLPVQARLLVNKVVDADWSASDFAQIDGFWYPTKLSLKRYIGPKPERQTRTTVASFRPRADFQDSDFQITDLAGSDIVDRRRGIAWHNDPWWAELQPWLEKQLSWPQPDMRGIDEIPSRSKLRIDGKPAPGIQAVEWLNGTAVDWSQRDHKVTIVFFFGGRAIRPTPQWLGAVRALRDFYRDHSVEVIGITSASGTPDLTKRDIRSLEIPFRVAIDQPDVGYGKTFNAFGLPHYAGIFLVDHDARVRVPTRETRVLEGVVDADTERQLGPLRSLLVRLLRDAGEKNVSTSIRKPRRLELADIKQIKAEWLRRRQTAPRQSVITGQVTDGKASMAGVAVQVIPTMKLLSSNLTGSWTLLRDRPSVVRVATDKNGMFAINGLCKGTYELTFAKSGHARVERTVSLVTNSDKVVTNVINPQGDRIAGRVLTNSGKPIANAVVRLATRHPNLDTPTRITTAHLPRTTVTTDKLGQFEFAGLYDGAYTIEVEIGGRKTSQPLIEAGNTDLKILVQP